MNPAVSRFYWVLLFVGLSLLLAGLYNNLRPAPVEVCPCCGAPQ